MGTWPGVSLSERLRPRGVGDGIAASYPRRLIAISLMRVRACMAQLINRAIKLQDAPMLVMHAIMHHRSLGNCCYMYARTIHAWLRLIWHLPLYGKKEKDLMNYSAMFSIKPACNTFIRNFNHKLKIYKFVHAVIVKIVKIIPCRPAGRMHHLIFLHPLLSSDAYTYPLCYKSLRGLAHPSVSASLLSR